MSNTPSDEELTACYREANGEMHGKAQPLTTQRIFRAMRAAIVKWGTPQPVVREPSPPAPDCGASSGGKTPRSNELEAARLSMKQTRTPAYGDALKLCRRLETELQQALSAVQQPVVREPLTLQQIAKAFAEAGLNPDDYPDDVMIEPLVRAIEHAHGIGIKGGQHGTE